MLIVISHFILNKLYNQKQNLTKLIQYVSTRQNLKIEIFNHFIKSDFFSQPYIVNVVVVGRCLAYYMKSYVFIYFLSNYIIKVLIRPKVVRYAKLSHI